MPLHTPQLPSSLWSAIFVRCGVEGWGKDSNAAIIGLYLNKTISKQNNLKKNLKLASRGKHTVFDTERQRRATYGRAIQGKVRQCSTCLLMVHSLKHNYINILWYNFREEDLKETLKAIFDMWVFDLLQQLKFKLLSYILLIM